MIALGTLVNAATVVAGGALGSLVIPRVPDNVRKTTMQALGLGVILIGLQMAWVTKELLLVLVALAIGTILGELGRIDDRLQGLAAKLERWPIARRDGFAKAFVQTTLLFCVGAMTITGSFQDGLFGDPSILLAKAVLDGVGAAMFGSVMGPGVMLSAIPVLLIQGTLTLGASWLSQVLTEPMIHEIGATGGLLVLGLGLNLVGAAEIKVANLLPALAVVAVLVAIF
ncbi:MAG: hypothetical protein K0R39_3641 [Symbiobacteriaceae bacterium]|jgi:uncharacterized membrane protein YqgA involved in biofilm formation|nr:hypothetical protein [Symbiobacteriaceae bacterium]